MTPRSLVNNVKTVVRQSHGRAIAVGIGIDQESVVLRRRNPGLSAVRY